MILANPMAVPVTKRSVGEIGDHLLLARKYCVDRYREVLQTFAVRSPPNGGTPLGTRPVRGWRFLWTTAGGMLALPSERLLSIPEQIHLQDSSVGANANSAIAVGS